MIALLADSQNTPIRMAWAGWPQAGWNHAGRGSVPTQEAKFPVVSRCFPCPDPKKRNSRSENREKFFRFYGKPIDEIHMDGKLLVSLIIGREVAKRVGGMAVAYYE